MCPRGLMRLLQWGRRLSTTETTCLLYGAWCMLLLQWGRRLSTTETWIAGTAIAIAAPASMGPSSFNDGNSGRGPWIWADGICFNGAVVFQRRKPDALTCDTLTARGASMGPSSFNDGNKEWPALPLATREASMGPSSFNDGNEDRTPAIRTAVEASMGPSSFNDGNPPSGFAPQSLPAGFNGAVVFQRRKRHNRRRQETKE